MTDGQEVRGINWEFNAWGGTEDGLYASWEKDNRFAPFFCEKEGYTWYDARPFVLEGGSVHSDGEGTVMVTESCLLSKGRNPDLTKEEITEKLKAYLGAEKVLWLPRGIYMDETNEHVDNVCAFLKPGRGDSCLDRQQGRSSVSVIHGVSGISGRRDRCEREEKSPCNKLPTPGSTRSA